MKVKYLLDEYAYKPIKAHIADAGFDIRTPKLTQVPPKSYAIIDTGLHMMIPRGFVGMIKSKSGLNVKHGLRCEGVVDAEYTGSIVIKIYNDSNDAYVFLRGDKVAQIVIIPVPEVEIEHVEYMKETDRGSGGFGSTGR